MSINLEKLSICGQKLRSFKKKLLKSVQDPLEKKYRSPTICITLSTYNCEIDLKTAPIYPPHLPRRYDQRYPSNDVVYHETTEIEQKKNNSNPLTVLWTSPKHNPTMTNDHK